MGTKFSEARSIVAMISVYELLFRRFEGTRGGDGEIQSSLSGSEKVPCYARLNNLKWVSQYRLRFLRESLHNFRLSEFEMAEIIEDVTILDPSKDKRKRERGHEITSRMIKAPPFSYAHLELTSTSTATSMRTLDEITIRSYLNSALTQFLGLSGAAITVDILKTEANECWVRVPRQDLSPFLAGVGGWIGEHGAVGWRVRSSGNWLSALVGNKDVEKIWND